MYGEVVPPCRLAYTLLQGYLAHKKHPSSLGPPYGPRHSPTVGSWEGDVSYERGAPVPRRLPYTLLGQS